MRRRDGSISSLRELTTLQRWIVEGKLAREDEVGLDGQSWRPLGSIPDLGTFFAAADALSRVSALEAELARARAAPQPPAADLQRTPPLQPPRAFAVAAFAVAGPGGDAACCRARTSARGASAVHVAGPPST